MRTRTRHRRAIHETGQPLRRVALQPPMHALAGHPEPSRHLDDRHPIAENFENGLIALLHHTQLQQHDATPRSRSRSGSTAREPAARNTTTGATVAHQPEPPSPRYRDRAGKRRTTTGAATSSIYRVSTRRGSRRPEGTGWATGHPPPHRLEEKSHLPGLFQQPQRDSNPCRHLERATGHVCQDASYPFGLVTWGEEGVQRPPSLARSSLSVQQMGNQMGNSAPSALPMRPAAPSRWSAGHRLKYEEPRRARVLRSFREQNAAVARERETAVVEGRAGDGRRDESPSSCTEGRVAAQAFAGEFLMPL